MYLSHDGDAQIVQGAPSTMLRMVPLPRCGRGGWGSHVPSPCGDVVLKFGEILYMISLDPKFPSPCGDVVLKFELLNACKVKMLKFPSPCGDMLYLPPPSKRGRWRAVRAGRGACSGCAFLTMEMRRSFKAPLPPCFAWSPSPAAAGEAGVRTFRPLAGMWF